MVAIAWLTEDELVGRLQRRYWAERDRERKAWPIGLHAWPKCSLRHWFGIGPVSRHTAVSWFDIRLSDDATYLATNCMVARACRRLGLAFINMA